MSPKAISVYILYVTDIYIIFNKELDPHPNSNKE